MTAFCHFSLHRSPLVPLFPLGQLIDTVRLQTVVVWSVREPAFISLRMPTQTTAIGTDLNMFSRHLTKTLTGQRMCEDSGVKSRSDVLFVARIKQWRKCTAPYKNPSQSYGASPAMWEHSVTCHPTQVNAPRLNPSQTSQYLIYLPRRDGKLSWR